MTSAVWPDPNDLMTVRTVDPPHPATLTPTQLLDQCLRRTQRRSGPGGQHRNKTSSGVFLVHEPTGIVGEATERRSQAQNREIAATRLRFKLATAVRTPSPLLEPTRSISETERGIRDRFRKTPLRINARNSDCPAVLAMLLDDLWSAGGQPSLVADAWQVSTSAMTRLLRQHPTCLALVNEVRNHHGRRSLT